MVCNCSVIKLVNLCGYQNVLWLTERLEQIPTRHSSSFNCLQRTHAIHIAQGVHSPPSRPPEGTHLDDTMWMMPSGGEDFIRCLRKLTLAFSELVISSQTFLFLTFHIFGGTGCELPWSLGAEECKIPPPLSSSQVQHFPSAMASPSRGRCRPLSRVFFSFF